MSLDPLANRIAREKEEAKKEKPPALNPDFPFRPTQVPLSDLSLDEDPPIVIDTGDSSA